MGSLIEASPALTCASTPLQNNKVGQYFESTTPIHEYPSLPNDILYDIFDYYLREQDDEIRKPSPESNPDSITKLWSTLRSLLFLSRRFYLVVRPFLYHTICLSNRVDIEKLYNTIRANGSIGEHVKSLLFIEPTDVTIPPKTTDPTPDLLCVVPNRSIRNWDPAQHSTALQLVFILYHLDNLRYFRFLSRGRFARFRVQPTFICYFNRLALRGGYQPLLASLEEVDLSGIVYPEQGALLHALVFRPNLQSLSLSGSAPELRIYYGPPHPRICSIRKLTITNPTALTDASTLVSLPTALEALNIHTCARLFFYPAAQRDLEATLKTQTSNLKELHLTTHCATAPNPNDILSEPYTPYLLSSYLPHLRALSIPPFLYEHNRNNLGIREGISATLPTDLRELTLSTWFCPDLAPDLITQIAAGSAAAAPKLERIVLGDMQGWARWGVPHMEDFTAVQEVCFAHGIRLVYRDDSRFSRANAPSWCGVCRYMSSAR
ncbi:hypothetical protein BJY00DRAFT_319396 [Aspergillus carlsbadensis]|nr:hypothetical protein BJY00DRAFT_319396 [Aspergillus carlsbadensis]